MINRWHDGSWTAFALRSVWLGLFVYAVCSLVRLLILAVRS